MRHAQQATTDNTYRGPGMEEKREANTGVVRMVLVRESSCEALNPNRAHKAPGFVGLGFWVDSRKWLRG